MRIMEKELNFLLSKYVQIAVSLQMSEDKQAMTHIHDRLFDEYMADTPWPIHPSQMVMDRKFDNSRMLEIIRLRWEPSTEATELVGGPMDGKIIAQPLKNIQRAYPFTIAMPVSDRFLFSDKESPIEPVPIDKFNYHMKGFDLEKNRWIYMP